MNKKKLRKYWKYHFVTVMLCIIAFASAPASAQINRDLDSYVLFALNELDFKGGNDGPAFTRGYVLGGNVGVNQDDNLGDNQASINVGANGIFVMSDGTQLVGGSIRLGTEASVWDVYVDREFGSGWSTANNTKLLSPPYPPPPATPVLTTSPVLIIRNTKYTISNATDLPIIPWADLTTANLCGDFDPVGTTDFTAPKNGPPVTLAPGAYRDVNVQNGGTLYLQAGVYTVRRFTTGQNVNVYTVPGTVIHVWGDGDGGNPDFNLGGNGSYFGSADPHVESVACICVSDAYSNNHVQFSDNGEFWGVIIAPNASINLGRNFTHYGRFVGNTLASDFNDNVTYKACTAGPEEPGDAPAIDVEKRVSDNGIDWYDADTAAEAIEILAGEDVYFQFIVFNMGNVTLTNITLNDDMYDTSGCTIPASLEPYTFFECVIGPFEATVGLHTNEATATGDYDEETYSDEDPANYFGADPQIDVEKYVSDNETDWYDADTAFDALPVIESLDVYFKFVVTNTGNVTLTNIVLSDDVYVLVCDIPAFLEPGEFFECKFGPEPACHGGQVDIATATGDYDGEPYSDEDPAYYFGTLIGEFRTQTPGGWGAPPEGNNPAAYLLANFESCFGDLVVGCDSQYTITMTSAGAIEAFLPTGGKPGSLKNDYVDPTKKTEAGTLAGHVIALALSVGFDICDDNFSTSETGLASLEVADEDSLCYGMTVQEVLDEAKKVLGDCDSGSFTPTQIYECVSAINENFVDGKTDNGFLKLPGVCE